MQKIGVSRVEVAQKPKSRNPRCEHFLPIHSFTCLSHARNSRDGEEMGKMYNFLYKKLCRTEKNRIKLFF